MEHKPLQNFLEVSINTEKFNLFANSIANAIATHDRQIQQHTKEMAQLKLNMEDRLSRMTCQLDYQKQRFDKKRKEDSAYFNSFIHDSARKYDVLASQSKMRLNALEEIVSKESGQKQMQLISSIKQEMKGTVLGQVSVLEEEMLTLEAQIKAIENELKKTISNQDFLLKNVLDAYEGKCKSKDSTQRGDNRKVSVSNFKPNKQQSNNNSCEEDKGFCLEQATLREGRERRRKKAQEKCERENLQYASISAKVDALENRLAAKENESINKVLWASKANHIPSQSSQQGIPLSMDRIEIERKTLETNITSKLQHIQQIIQQKFANNEKAGERMKCKFQILQEQVDSINHRFQKQKTKISDLSMQFKKVEEKRVDDKLIENLVMLQKKQNNNLQELIEGKVGKENWQKQKSRLNQRLQILSESLSQKADKEEIKKAFQFIEDKIKEIVVIIADDTQQQKDGAGRKLPFKCLSCDKDLDSSVPNTQRPQQSFGPSRSNSSNLRRRIRIGQCDSR